MEHKRKRVEEKDEEKFIFVPPDPETHVVVSSSRTGQEHRLNAVYDPTIQQIQDLQICDPHLLQVTLLLLCGIPPLSGHYVLLNDIVTAFSVMRSRYTLETLQLQESVIREMLYDFLRAGIVNCNIKNQTNPNGLPRPVMLYAPVGGERKLMFCLSSNAQRDIFAPLQFHTSMKSIITNALDLAGSTGENPTDVVGQSLIIHLELLRMFRLSAETEEEEEEAFPSAVSTPPLLSPYEDEENASTQKEESEEK